MLGGNTILRGDDMAKPFEFEIKKIYADLRRSEQKVADCYLNYQGELEDLGLVQISEAAGVSQPTVMRFVQAIGFQGFKEFKYAVLKNYRKNEVQGGEDREDSSVFPPPVVGGCRISEKDCLEEVSGRVVSQSIVSLDETLKHVSASEVARAAKKICEARQIAIYYVENSASVANDLLTKLLYLGFNCVTYSDSYLQQISANNLSEQDVAIGISYSGTSKNTVDVMKLAKKKKAGTIVITNFQDSLIAKYADILLCSGNQQLMYGNAIFSRASQIAIVDMIYMGVILQDYPKYTKKLDGSSRVIKNQTY